MPKPKSAAEKVSRSFLSMIKRLFVRDTETINVLEEDAIRTPARVIMTNLVNNKLAVIGFCGFLLIFLFSFVGSKIFPVSLTYNEFTNSNLKPGTNFLKYPKSLNNKKIVKIVSGVSFSVALDDRGDLTIWGTECNLNLRNVSDPIMAIPDEIKRAKIVDLEAGANHVVCIDDKNNFYGWGFYGNNQTIMPFDVALDVKTPGVSIVQMAAMRQWTAVLDSEGYLHIWGSRQAITVYNVPEAYQGRIAHFTTGDNNMALVLDDGSVVIIGLAGNEFSLHLPNALKDGSVRLTDIAATNLNVLALDDTGNLYLWGSAANRLNAMPEITGKPVYINAGYKNFTVVTDDGSVVTWGANELKQLKMPKNLSGVEKVYVDYFQFYAMDGAGKIIGAWGNKGYVWGSDQFGRDMFTRIIHGGKISLTVGAQATLVSIAIAILVGLISGYFGGWIDHLLMRVADIFSALPFLPIAVTLSYIIGHQVSNVNRVYMIMFVLGFLGWMGLARLIRAQLLLEREKDFVLAARSLGIKQKNIMLKHILPNVINLIIVNITLSYAGYMLSEAGLSFLGFGITEPTPTWGNMLTSAQESAVIQYYWWRWIIPALFVVAAALSVNMLSDALREAMDPRANER